MIFMFFRNYINRKNNTRFEERVRRRRPYLKYRSSNYKGEKVYTKYDIGEDIYFDRAPLPNAYLVNEITLLPKNITTVFAFWEIREESYRILKEKYNIQDDAVIKLYKDENLYRVIRGLDRFGSYYINNVEGDKNYVAKIGYMDSNNNFYELSCSTQVITPSGKISPNVATKWAISRLNKGKIEVEFYSKDKLPEDKVLALEITDPEILYSNDMLLSKNYYVDENGNIVFIGSSNKLVYKICQGSSKL